MTSIRFSSQRYFVEKFKCDIISDQPFHEGNTVFTNVLKDMKARGKGDTMHYPEIEPEDVGQNFRHLRKISSLLSDKVLSDKV